MTADLPTPRSRPVATAELDNDLRRQLRRFQRLRWILVCVTGALVIIGLVIGGILLARQQKELTASCSLYRDLGTLSLKPTPPLHHVGEISVVIVLDARSAFIGQCKGPLPPADDSLKYWAGYYNLTVPAPEGRE